MSQPQHTPDPASTRAIRHDGITPERQADFLTTLAATGSVSQAAAAAGVSRTALYRLRNSAEGAVFRARWAEALREAVAVLAEAAFDRALNGVSEPVWYKGEQIGERVRHDNRLLMFLLRAHDPATYAPPPRPSGITPVLVSTLGNYVVYKPTKIAHILRYQTERVTMSVLSSPHFHDEAKAFEYLEQVVWANGVTCPHCGVVSGRVYDLSGVRSKPSKKHPEGVVRHGLKKCGECRSQFTVKVGTVFEHARMPLHKMLQAVHLMMSSKKGISSHQLSRVLEVQYKTAWFLAHRIREAMRDGELAPFGGTGGRVEVDETYIGRKKGAPVTRGGHHKMRVVSLVDRETGLSRSIAAFGLSKDEVADIVRANVAREAVLTTDESSLYRAVGREYAGHDKVNHLYGEYVNRKNPSITTNTVEGFFSIFKRGMRGVYQHCSEKHLHRYLAEFDFRYSFRVGNGFDDRARGVEAVKGIAGKRLTYKGPNVSA